MPNKPNLGNVIATRKLELDGEPGVSVRIGMPVPDPESDGKNYCCPFLIEGVLGNRLRHAYGIDSVSALQFALQMIGLLLYSSNEYKAGRLRWLEMKDLEFPVTNNVRDLMPQEHARRRLGMMIDDLASNQVALSEFTKAYLDYFDMEVAGDLLEPEDLDFFGGIASMIRWFRRDPPFGRDQVLTAEEFLTQMKRQWERYKHEGKHFLFYPPPEER